MQKKYRLLNLIMFVGVISAGNALASDSAGYSRTQASNEAKITQDKQDADARKIEEGLRKVHSCVETLEIQVNEWLKRAKPSQDHADWLRSSRLIPESLLHAFLTTQDRFKDLYLAIGRERTLEDEGKGRSLRLEEAEKSVDIELLRYLSLCHSVPQLVPPDVDNLRRDAGIDGCCPSGRDGVDAFLQNKCKTLDGVDFIMQTK